MATSPVMKSKSGEALPTSGAFPPGAVSMVSEALNLALANLYALYLKTKNFHWHVSGPHFRDYHEMFDVQAAQILAATDGMAERVRKLGAGTLKSIGHIAKLQRLKDNDAEFVASEDMLRELMEDNRTLLGSLRAAHEAAGRHDDVATVSLLENWIDEAEQRVWFLLETSRAVPR